MKITQESLKQARELVATRSYGILSTNSVKFEGFPFGSVVPYCIDQDGMFIFLLSAISQHTINIKTDSKVSLIILDETEANIQANARITLLGHLQKAEGDTSVIQARYHRYFPATKDYPLDHGFGLYRLYPADIRYIGGFAQAYWLRSEEFLEKNPFFGEVENRIVTHMNEDHQDSLLAYCRYYKQLDVSETEEVQMIGIDTHGFEVLVQGKKVRFSLEKDITTAKEAREILVKMSKTAMAAN